MNAQMLLAFEDDLAQARALARALDVPSGVVRCHRFPDGEFRLTLPASLPERVALLRGLHTPNDRLVQLSICAPAARELGARELALVCPYLAYMRQDIAFQPGEAVSQRHVGRWLAGLFDALVTVDPHLHRISSLDEVMPGCRNRVLSAAGLLGEWVARRIERPLLVGPDEESGQWVGAAAQAHRLEHAVCRKQRSGDCEVEVALPQVDLRGRAVVLMDDVASTGRTLLEAGRACLRAGAASVDVAVTHALLPDDAVAMLRGAGLRHLWSTDSIAHPSSVVSVVGLLAEGVRAV